MSRAHQRKKQAKKVIMRPVCDLDSLAIRFGLLGVVVAEKWAVMAPGFVKVD